MEQLFNLMHRVLRISKDQFRDDFGPKQIQTWDSLTHLGLISELEDVYDIEFDGNYWWILWYDDWNMDPQLHKLYPNWTYTGHTHFEPNQASSIYTNGTKSYSTFGYIIYEYLTPNWTGSYTGYNLGTGKNIVDLVYI